MARVRAFTLSGVRLWFWSNDHDPPHLHAEAADWELTVAIESLTIVVKRGTGPRGRVRRELLRLIENHRIELLEEWEAIHG